MERRSHDTGSRDRAVAPASQEAAGGPGSLAESARRLELVVETMRSALADDEVGWSGLARHEATGSEQARAFARSAARGRGSKLALGDLFVLRQLEIVMAMLARLDSRIGALAERVAEIEGERRSDELQGLPKSDSGRAQSGGASESSEPEDKPYPSWAPLSEYAVREAGGSDNAREFAQTTGGRHQPMSPAELARRALRDATEQSGDGSEDVDESGVKR